MLRLFQRCPFFSAFLLLVTTFSYMSPSAYGMQTNPASTQYYDELFRQEAEKNKVLSDVLLDVKYFLVKMVASDNIVGSEKMAVDMEKKVNKAKEMASKEIYGLREKLQGVSLEEGYKKLKNGEIYFDGPAFKWLEGLASLIKKTRKDPISARVEAVQNYMKSQDKE